MMKQQHISTSMFIIIILSMLSVVHGEVIPPHRRPFPAASVVAACIAGGIVLAGMTLAFLLALPRVLLYLRNKFVTDEEDDDEEENQDAAQVANSSVGGGQATTVGTSVELKNTGSSISSSSVVHSSAANLEN